MSSDGDGRSDGRTAWTLGAIKQRNLALEGYCQTEGCGHFYMFKVDDLITRPDRITWSPKFCRVLFAESAVVISSSNWAWCHRTFEASAGQQRARTRLVPWPGGLDGIGGRGVALR